MKPTKEQAQAAMSRVVNSLDDGTDCVTVVLYITELERAIADLNEVIADKRRLARELDVAMNGKKGAAKQASLCDLVGQVRDMREQIAAKDARIAALEADVARKDRAIERLVRDTPLLDDCLRCPALCDKCATNAGTDACLESLREWAIREGDNE